MHNDSNGINTDLTKLVAQAQTGDTLAFDRIVLLFQDRAVGYAFSLLGNFDLAQDAALDAFIQAYYDLPSLRAPGAFPAWFRQIIFKHCDRMTRGRRVVAVPLEAAAQTVSPEVGPQEAAEYREMQKAVHQAIESLPPGERAVTVLFYIGEHSQREIAAFLGIPVTTVKSRLYSARARLKERMIAMIQDTLEDARPSQNSTFATRIGEDVTRALTEIAAGDVNESVTRKSHPLARYRDPHSVYQLTSSLIMAALARDVSEMRLVPGSKDVSVLFIIRDAQEEFLRLPKPLQEPVTARLKDGADLNVAVRHVVQEGHTPLHDTRSNTLYDMQLTFHPNDQGESIILRFIPVVPEGIQDNSEINRRFIGAVRPP